MAAAPDTAIPLVDVGALAGTDRAAREAVAARIGESCREVGFLYVVNHGVPEAVVAEAFDAAARFFAQDADAKRRIRSDRNNRGYRVPFETVHRNGKVNSVDSFDMGYPLAPDDPDVLAGLPLHAPNRWPELAGFRPAIEAYYFGLLGLGMRLLEGFAIHLGVADDFFTRHFRKPIADMSLNHYPAPSEVAGITDQASGAHTDHGIITILAQDACGGLEVMRRDGTMVPATPIPGTLVVNVGELMRRWTNGRFRATVHQVVHRQERPRYSMPLFFNPDFRTVVDPRDLPGVTAAECGFEPVESGEFLVGRFRRTRKSWGAENAAAPAPVSTRADGLVIEEAAE